MSDRSKRHWSQFSLKTLLVGITALCIGPGWGVALWRNEGRKREEAAFAVTSLGGTCYYYVMSRAVAVRLADTKTTDADLSRITGLPGLSEVANLDLGRTHITDAGMAHLARLKNLRVLNLHGTQVTDQGISELQKAMPDLEITTSERVYWD